MNNAKLAEILYKIADQLEEEENNPYRIRAYRRAAKSIKIYSKNVEQLVKSQEDLTIISHVGEKLAGKIKQIILEGTQSIHQKKRKTLIYKRDTFKPFIFRIYSIQPLAEKIIAKLKKIPFIQEFQCTGDFRRKKEIIQDLIIVISTQNKLKTLERFYRIPYIKSILKKSTNMTTVELKKGIPLTLYFVDQKTIGGKVIQTTGSHLHVEQLKEIAAKHHLKLNDKGLYKKNKKIAAYSEKEIYEHLNLQYIPPELREGTGEVTAASLHSLPQLIQLKDIRGDLHSHTNETDGSYTLEEMVAAAKQYHYEYLAITDHSQSLKITRGMDAKRLFMQIKKIDKLNELQSNFVILKSMEVDILEDGTLDLPNDVLKELDLTVCSIHSKFHLNIEKQTERVIRAMDNPHFNILGHPTGRLIRYRQPYQLDFERILKAAHDRHCFLELNAQPARLDINEKYCKRAKEEGVKIAISSDAHTTKGFSFMALGINQARRGWLEAKDVINTYPLAQLKKLLKK